ncbi:uncharacterized protein METZ01_LOCUS154388 [marine metagenome]|uniref:Uncharacterized protein n=1 Tax=marine metagenome TaxID=408172 RepID=A0A382AJJ1_9ZZZZ
MSRSIGFVPPSDAFVHMINFAVSPQHKLALSKSIGTAGHGTPERKEQGRKIGKKKREMTYRFSCSVMRSFNKRMHPDGKSGGNFQYKQDRFGQLSFDDVKIRDRVAKVVEKEIPSSLTFYVSEHAGSLAF